MFTRKMDFCVVFVLCLILGLCDSQLSDAFRPLRQLFNVSGGPIKEAVDFKKSYDFIVIGAGSGGSVVTNRLSENPKWSVLLLEAGRDEIFLTDVPLIASLLTATGYNWGYRSERLETACLGLWDGRCNIPRGKALGGTSVINFLLYSRGNKKDFDEWEELGNKGWSYEDVLPYFTKSENCSLCHNIDTPFHGFNGYLSVEHPGHFSSIAKSFLNSAKYLGYEITDPNGRQNLGFSTAQATMRKGARCSASKAFLKPVQDRPNLFIHTGARVTRILVDPKSKRAYGVEVLKNDEKHYVKAKKEVILSAGSINSPHLLMLSGIGPRENLEKVNIPVIQDLKVGFNLQDHMAMSTLAFLVNESVTVSDLRVQNPRDIFNYIVNGKGPFTIPGGAEALAFIKTKYSTNLPDDYPDIELVLGGGALNGDIFGSLRNLLGIPDETFMKVYGNILNVPAFGIAPVLMRPKSKGRVLLKDSNPLHWPVLKPDYFSHPDDVNVLVEGIKMAVAIADSPPFKRFNATIHKVPFPGCEHLPFGSHSYWECLVRRVATTLGHQVGTCKMGPDSDPDAVVDPRLRVRGVKGLRVVDGSVMPNIIAGHPNAVIFMIGEKAADMIKEEWRDFS